MIKELTNFEKLLLSIVAIVAIFGLVNVFSSDCGCSADTSDNQLTARAVIDTRQPVAEPFKCDERYYCQWSDVYFKSSDCLTEKVQDCQFGCLDGACRDNPDLCLESDDGPNVNVKGYIETADGVFHDSCIQGKDGQESAILLEMSCDFRDRYVRVNCENFGKKCHDGACVDICQAGRFCVGNELYEKYGDCSEGYVGHCDACFDGRCA